MTAPSHQTILRQGELLRALFEAKAAPPPSFSAVRVVRALAEDRRPSGFEGELIDMANATRGTSGAFASTDAIPWAVLSEWQRDLTVGTASAGGYLAGTDLASAVGPFDGSAAATLGVDIVTGAQGNVVVPTSPGTLPLTWLMLESSTPSAVTPTIGQVAAVPKMASVTVNISDLLLKQGAGAEPYVRGLLLQAARAALDVAVFAGSGTAGEPLGLMHYPAIETQNGASFALATAAAAQKSVADALIEDSATRWIAAPAVREILQQRVAFAGTASPLWADDRMLSRAAIASNRMPAASLLYGAFGEVRALLWGSGIEVMADPFSNGNFRNGVVTLRVIVALDVVVPRPAALVRIEDFS